MNYTNPYDRLKNIELNDRYRTFTRDSLYEYYEFYISNEEKYNIHNDKIKIIHPILKENLIKFYNENKEFLKLKKEINEWDSPTFGHGLITTNNKIKGKMTFTQFEYFVQEVKGKSLFSTSKWLNPEHLECLYYIETPIIRNFQGVEFPSCENGKHIFKEVEKMVNNIISQYIQHQKQLFRTKEENQKLEKEKTEDLRQTLFSKLDKDNNGTIDIVEEKNEFNLLLKKHQKVVIEKGKEFNQNYTHQFIKVGNYIKQKRSNLQLIFDCIKQVQNQQDLDEYVEILESEIYSYNLLLINSLNLIVSLIEDDQITFYDIYEKFDKLGIYNSNWENEISQKLTTLNKGISELNSNIKGLMYEIRDMGDRIVNSIEDLSYITEESTRMLDNRLGEIDSSIKTNNLLTLIQTYQTYKINQNTKSLRG